MGALLLRRSRIRTVADIIAKLGDIPPERILLEPAPGTATEKDLIRVNDGNNPVCELVFGTLVEKPTGFEETNLELWLGHLLHQYLEVHDIGDLVSGTGFMRLAKGVIRAPDISFFTWKNATTIEEDRKHPIANTFPNLAVEIVSRSNTAKELTRKRKEYFNAGTTLVWQVYPKKMTVEVYTSPKLFKTLTVSDTLDGGEVLPGLKIPLKRLFRRQTKGTK